MRGIGWIFEEYRSGRVEADDEVALMYSPRGFTPLTVPLINVRRWVHHLAASGAVDEARARTLLGPGGRHARTSVLTRPTTASGP